jgi:HNH endonuclease
MEYSKANGHIIEAYEQGYRADLETGEIYSRTGKKLRLFRKSRLCPLLQFSARISETHLALHRDGPGNPAHARRCNIDAYRFIEYCKIGGAAFEKGAVVHADGNKLNLSPDNIVSCTRKEAGEITRRNHARKK